MNHLGDTNKMGKPETYMTIHADGRITVSEKLQPSETAARVLECMKTQWMDDAQSKQIRELRERIKRLEEDGDEAICPIEYATRVRIWTKAKEAKL